MVRSALLRASRTMGRGAILRDASPGDAPQDEGLPPGPPAQALSPAPCNAGSPGTGERKRRRPLDGYAEAMTARTSNPVQPRRRVMQDRALVALGQVVDRLAEGAIEG